MTETTFTPKGKAPRDEAVRPEPITDRPKMTKREELLQHQRERAGLGLMQLIGFGAGFLGRFRILPVLPEDVAAITVFSPPIAKGLADCAADDERFAKVFDRLTAVGPYGALLEPIAALAMQISANHNEGVRSGQINAAQLGVIPPERLMAMMEPNGDGSSAG